MDSMRFADRTLASFGEAQKTHFARSHQIAHRAGHLLDWDRRVNTMLVKQVNTISSEASEGTFHRFANVIWAAIGADNLALFHPPTELCGQNHLISFAFEC